MYKTIDMIENLAFSFELNDNFKSFNSFEFIQKYKNDELTKDEEDTFFKMCFIDEKIQKTKKKEYDKINKR